MPKLFAVVGALVICAGIDLLWQSRMQLQYWLEVYAKFLNALLRRQLTARIVVSVKSFIERQAAIQVLLGLGLVFFLGPLLLVVSLTILLRPQ